MPPKILLRRRCAIPSWRVALIAISIGLLLTAAAAHPQGRGSSASVVVKVVASDGSPISAEVDLIAEGSGSGENQITGSDGMANFQHVARGNYQISVQAQGYQNGAGGVDVSSGLGTFEAVVALQRELPEDAVAKGMVLAPKAQKELDLGTKALRELNYDEAQKHLEAAYKLAPGNPDVNDRLGELYLFKKDLAKAEQYLQQAASIAPDDVKILSDFGQLRLEQGDQVNAETILERAVAIAPDQWFSHWLLGVAYLRENEFEKARVQAAEAIKDGKGAANAAQYLLGEALAGLGRKDEAIQALQLFIKNSPNNSFVPAAQSLITKLQAG